MMSNLTSTDHRAGSYLAALGVTAACVVAAFVTAPFLGRPLEIDETVSFWIADGSGRGTLLGRSLQYSATPPLSFAIQRVLLGAFGSTELVLRFPSWTSYIGAVVAVGYLSHRWLNPVAGVLAALLLALHPMAQKFAVQGRPYSVGLLLAIGAVGATWTIARAGFHWRRFGAWFALNVALGYTHYLFVLLWTVEFVWLAIAARRGTVRLTNVVLWFGCLGLAVLPLSSAMLYVWEHREFLNWNPAQRPWADLVAPLLPFRWLRARQPAIWITLAVGLAWHAARFGVRPRNWFDGERFGPCAGMLVHAGGWVVGPVGVLAILGRFWLPSLATDRYMLIYVPGGVVLFAGLLSGIRGRILPGVLLLVLVWLQADLGGVRAAHDRWFSRRTSAPAASDSISPDQRWKDVATSLSGLGPHDRVLVGTGLTEMTLVPVYFADVVFQDYVTCRLSRIYFQGQCERMALPMNWTRELATAYQRRPPVPDSAQPNVLRTIWLIAATDTDRLLATTEQARVLIKSWGWLESSLDHRSGVLVARYVPPSAED